MDPDGHSKCPAHAECLVDHYYAPFKGNCDVCMRRFHLVERADKVEDRKVLGKELLDWFRKVLRHFILKKWPGVVWADEIYHLRFLAQLHELSRRKLEWLSVDQRLLVYGVSGPVTDGILRRTAALPSSQQKGLSGFGSVGLQGDHDMGDSQQLSRPIVPTGVGVREEVIPPSQCRGQVRFSGEGREVFGPSRSASSSGGGAGPWVTQPSVALVGPPVVEPSSAYVSGRGDSGVVSSPPHRSSVAEDPEFHSLKSLVISMANSVKALVDRNGPSSEPAPVADAALQGVIPGISPLTSQQTSPREDEETNFLDRSGEESAEEGSMGHQISAETSGPNKWYFPRPDWLPVWDDNQKVIGFRVGKTRVPGSFKFEDTDMGIRWRYDLGNSLDSRY